ncbi:MAG: diguanylate cyclase [Candidatus Omnitrophica bacterium]|nr:diguanylate cyclase [Candidatus Omnitrophota bacterium]
MENVYRILVVSRNEKLRSLLDFCFKEWKFEFSFDASYSEDIRKIVKYSPDVILVDIHEKDKAHQEFCHILKNDFATTSIPLVALIDKSYLKKHPVNLRHNMDDYIIKPPDTMDLRVRIDMAVKRGKQCFFANPLTALPGGIIMEDAGKKKIESGAPFAIGHVDIDNFKSYNDKYGYMMGDRIIMQTAYMLRTSLRKHGNKSDFLGHIGGDDFVFITTPDKYKKVCQDFICTFDTIMPFHYLKSERKVGYILARDRANVLRKLPLMSVTIALVLKTGPADIKSIIVLNEKIAEVKKYLKAIPGSKFMADRRVKNKNDHLTLEVFNNHRSVNEIYKPLGQILISRKCLSREQLDEALKIHWKRGELLGEVLVDLGYIDKKCLTGILMAQQKNLDKMQRLLS